MRLALAVVVLLAVAVVPLSWQPEGVKVGSKKFTESVILGEMVKLLGENADAAPVTHYRELGGTRLVYQALLNGDIDIYPEYTGTIADAIVPKDQAGSMDEMRQALRASGILMSKPLGFSNDYVIGMTKPRAAELGITKISDLVRHPDLVFGFGNEFLKRRDDGWVPLQKHYDLPQQNVSGLDHDLAYRQLKLGAIDVIDAYRTDAKVAVYDLQLLEDDLNFFPKYEAVLLYREDLADEHPDVLAAILRLEGAISEESMKTANSQAEIDRVSERRVAAEFLQNQLDVSVRVEVETQTQRIVKRTIEHLDLVRKSLIPAILVAIPLGVFAAKSPAFGQVVLAVVGIVQTIPSLALLVILMPVISAFGLASVGLGSLTAVTALFLYSLLPIVRNTHAGLAGISGGHREAALALGLPPAYRLFHIELPLASRSILAGIKTAAVLNIGFATLGALIGAGGYGQSIITGIRLNSTSLILEGAIPAAGLALIAQYALEACEQFLVPKGLRV